MIEKYLLVVIETRNREGFIVSAFFADRVKKALRIWFDPEGDLLEIGQTKPTKGFFRDVGDDIFVRVDHKGNITGFLILNATKRMAKIREVNLPVKATFSKANESTS